MRAEITLLFSKCLRHWRQGRSQSSTTSPDSTDKSKFSSNPGQRNMQILKLPDTKPASVLAPVGAAAFVIAVLGWMGSETQLLADFRLAYGWPPAYTIVSFLFAGAGLVAIALGKPQIGKLAGWILTFQGAILLLGGVGAGAWAPWFEELLTEYTGYAPFSLLSGVRGVILCNLSLGFALVLMETRISFVRKEVAIGFLGAFITAQPLSEVVSYGLRIHTQSDLSLPLFVVINTTRGLLGWSVLMFACTVLRPQLRLERIPWLPLSLVLLMLISTLTTWRALIAESEERLREMVHGRLDHVKSEIADGLDSCFHPVLMLGEDWVKGRMRQPPVPQLHLVHGHREGLLSIEAVDGNYRSYWRIVDKTTGGRLDWRRFVVSKDEILDKDPVLTTALDGKAHRFLFAVPALNTVSNGFLIAIYDADELFKHILHEHALDGINLTLVDKGRELYAHSDGDGVNRWAQEASLDLYGKVLRLRVIPTEALINDTASPLPWFVLFTGLSLTLALAWVYYLGRLEQVRVMHLADEITRREQVEATLQKVNEELERRVRERTHELANEKELLAVTMESIGDGVITTDNDGVIRSINHVAQAMTGWRAEQAIGKEVNSVFLVLDPSTRQALENPVMQALISPHACHTPHKSLLIARDGRELLVADSAARIRDRSDRVLGVVLVFKDITEAQKMEEELFRARNLDAIGLLAGGIAHDFNNILTGITGNVSLAKVYAKPGDMIYESLDEAEKAFTRARDLTMQLLTFSRGGAPIRKSASVPELIRDTANFVLRGTNVRAQIEISDDLWAADIDQGQISQAINNLLINATQAMPDGGTVVILARNRELVLNEKPIAAGRYVEMTVRDQGRGITPENMQKIFEPYFTTKRAGNGLGLATTYSIIKRHKGHIEVESVAGEGTTFHIYLPAAEEIPSTETESPHGEDLRGSGRVLVMDDDEQIRDVAARSLIALGYDVSCASSGEEAIVLYRTALQEGRPFDAVILDLTVPGGMGGRECLEQLRCLDGHVRAIVSSGYSNDPTLSEHERHGFDATVVKPYVIQQLGSALREVMRTSVASA